MSDIFNKMRRFDCDSGRTPTLQALKDRVQTIGLFKMIFALDFK